MDAAAQPVNGSSVPMLSVVVPAYNEGSNVEIFFQRLAPVLEAAAVAWEVVFVNDGSADDTQLRLLDLRSREPRAVVVELSRNFGKECALSAGLAHARGQAVVTMDADLQHPPETIPDLLAEWRKGHEVVFAVRDERAGQAAGYRFSARAFYFLFRKLSSIPLSVEGGDFALLDRRVVDVLNLMPERHRFLKGLFAWVGFRRTSVTYHQGVRLRGTSKWGTVRLVRFAIDGIATFTTLPLRVWSLIGALISGASFLYIVIRLIRVVIHGIDVPGYESTLVAVLFLGGIQLLSLGILGEYIGRVFEEVKGRPLYVVRQVYRQEAGSVQEKADSA
jgi:glycosyltransferase involved in cell wall biosynthesis